MYFLRRKMLSLKCLIHFRSTSAYPITYSSANTNGQIISKQQQLLYKTTIPVNEQWQEQEVEKEQQLHQQYSTCYQNKNCHCKNNEITGTLQTADRAKIMTINDETSSHTVATTATATISNNNLFNMNNEQVGHCLRRNCDITAEIPSYAHESQCACHYNSNSRDTKTGNFTTLTNTIASIPNIINENHTTTKTRTTSATDTSVATSTTTTTVEYELSNGIAKLCKIQTVRNVTEQQEENQQQLYLYTKNTELDSTVIESNSQLSDIIEIVRGKENNSNCDTKNVAYVKNSTIRNIPLLSSCDLQVIQQNLNAINRTFQTNPNSHLNLINLNKSGINYQQYNNYTHLVKMEPINNGLTRCHVLGETSRDRLGFWGTGGDNEIPGTVSGLERLRNKKYNKGLAFTLEERQLLGIQGLLPAVVKTNREQLEHCLCLFRRLDNDLDKFRYLNGLSERNERLFYQLLESNISEMMPIVYTPTVGLACQNYSLIYEYPKGLYITIKDKDHVYDVLRNWPETDVRVIVVTDGERILGLGDLGANGMGIPVGKLSLYTALAGVKPTQCLPITLDVGTNNQNLIQDPLYVGLRQMRVTGTKYDNFLDEFMQAVVRRYGQNCLIQFEDFANDNAFRLLAKYRNNYCTFNDDIQGTACVAVGGLLASLKIKNTKLKENRILFFGAGEAALGIANLCVMALKEEGLSDAEARKLIYMLDSKGLIVKNRPSGGLTSHKLQFAQDHEPINDLLEAVQTLKPSILIGAAARGGAFTPQILELMAEFNETPIIFALSNPTHKAECTAENAYKYTKGKCIFASGSPFGEVEYEGKIFTPGQGNNAYVFPGIGLGVICSGILTIPEELFLLTAKCLANLVNNESLDKGSLYPPLENIQNISIEIASSIMEYAFKKGVATVHPEPENKRDFVTSQMYNATYASAIPEVYVWNNKL